MGLNEEERCLSFKERMRPLNVAFLLTPINLSNSLFKGGKKR